MLLSPVDKYESKTAKLIRLAGELWDQAYREGYCDSLIDHSESEQ